MGKSGYKNTAALLLNIILKNISQIEHSRNHSFVNFIANLVADLIQSRSLRNWRCTIFSPGWQLQKKCSWTDNNQAGLIVDAYRDGRFLDIKPTPERWFLKPGNPHLFYLSWLNCWWYWTRIEPSSSYLFLIHIYSGIEIFFDKMQMTQLTKSQLCQIAGWRYWTSARRGFSASPS